MSTPAPESRAWLVPVAALFVATVAVITTQSIVPGLLPQLARDLGVDIPTAGLLITAFGLTSAVAGPVLALMTGGVSRKRLMLAAVVVFIDMQTQKPVRLVGPDGVVPLDADSDLSTPATRG